MSRNMETPQPPSPANDDPNRWLGRVKRLFERSVIACQQITEFCKQLQGSEQPSPQDQIRYGMLSTEMIIAMHNVREGIEEALLTLAAVAQPDGFKEQAKELFGISHQETGKELEHLFQRVVEDGEMEGYLPVGKITLAPESGVKPEEYLGSLDYLKEMTEKYQYYDFANVPKAMEGACRKKGTLADPFMKSSNLDDPDSRLENPPSTDEAAINPEELIKFEKMCEELSEDANIIYGQLCAIGALYRAAIDA